MAEPLFDSKELKSLVATQKKQARATAKAQDAAARGNAANTVTEAKAAAAKGAPADSAPQTVQKAGKAARILGGGGGDSPIVPVAMVVLGLYLCWFAIRYWASDTKWPSDPIKAILTGKGLPVADRSAQTKILDQIKSSGSASVVQTIPGVSGSTAAGGGGSIAGPTAPFIGGQAIATTALKYKGLGYVFGGNASAPGNWDCSSFVSYVLGHDLGHPLPGGKWGDPGFPPHTHGPTTSNYMMFGTPVALSQVQPGDLVVSSGHMGIILSPTTYISARTPALGVGIDNFPANFPDGTPVYRRIT